MVKTKFNLELKLELDLASDSLSAGFSLEYEEALQLRLDAINQIKRFLASQIESTSSQKKVSYCQFLNIYCSVATNIEQALYLILVSRQTFTTLNTKSGIIEEATLLALRKETDYSDSSNFMNLDLSASDLEAAFRIGSDRAKDLIMKGLYNVKANLHSEEPTLLSGLWNFINPAESVKELYYLTSVYSDALKDTGKEI